LQSAQGSSRWEGLKKGGTCPWSLLKKGVASELGNRIQGEPIVRRQSCRQVKKRGGSYREGKAFLKKQGGIRTSKDYSSKSRPRDGARPIIQSSGENSPRTPFVKVGPYTQKAKTLEVKGGRGFLCRRPNVLDGECCAAPKILKNLRGLKKKRGISSPDGQRD